jgi:hypothetical protein
LLADADAFADHFGLRLAHLPTTPEEEPDAKRALVRACSRSSARRVRAGMTRASGDHPGPEYTSMLTEFVTHVWHPERAADRAPSLRRALSDVTARFA